MINRLIKKMVIANQPVPAFDHQTWTSKFYMEQTMRMNDLYYFHQVNYAIENNHSDYSLLYWRDMHMWYQDNCIAMYNDYALYVNACYVASYGVGPLS